MYLYNLKIDKLLNASALNFSFSEALKFGKRLVGTCDIKMLYKWE